MLPPDPVEKKSPTFHDFPYSDHQRKCIHSWIINVTPPGKNQCVHRCIYCYAREAVYARDLERMQIYTNLPELVERELSKITLCPPVSISNVSDPCQAIPELRCEVKRLVTALIQHGVSFFITTKGDASFLLDVPGFTSCENKAVAITIEGTPDLLPLLSPGAPPLNERLNSLRMLSAEGVATAVRLDPLFIHLYEALYGREWFDQVYGLLQQFSHHGAGHIICGTGRLTRRSAWRVSGGSTDTSWGRVHDIIGRYSAQTAVRFSNEYVYQSGWMGRGYMLRRDLRISLHSKLREATEDLGMTYAVCQELPADICDSEGIPHCLGFPLPFTCKSDDGRFHPVEGCTANCRGCFTAVLPPCGRPAIAGTRPLTISMLK